MVPVRNAASAANARSKKITVRSAGGSRLLKFADLDLRSTAGRVYRARAEELISHLGGADMVSAPMRTLVDQAARLHLLRRIAWDELSKTGPFHRGDARPALTVYQRLAADERDVLRTLGLQRVAREIPRLADVVSGRTL